MGKIYVVGIGPGSEKDMTIAAREALETCDVAIGYKYYMRFIAPLISAEARMIDTGMKREIERAAIAFEEASKGAVVAVVSSGDAGIYGMAPLLFEMREKSGSDVEIEVIPGISAFQKAASLLGSPIGHDFCVISLSDLLTPWSKIEARIRAAAEADFVCAIYNPRSHQRYWQLPRLKEIFLQSRSGDTPVGIVRQAGREDQSVRICTLKDFNPEDADMFTLVMIGNSASRIHDCRIITPRGYYAESENTDVKIGAAIMTESFRKIERELSNPDIPLYLKWPMLHAIHTTADFDMENILIVDENAPEKILSRLLSSPNPTIVTDVTMAMSGIRKGALERLGIKAICYLNEPRTTELAASQGITRSQAGIRLAVGEHPDALFVFGNAPTALMELCVFLAKGDVCPAGIVAAPVGFVHVCESKHMVKPFVNVPKIIVEGRKGGSNLAATLVNSILCWPDAAQLKPGRDV